MALSEVDGFQKLELVNCFSADEFLQAVVQQLWEL